MRRMERMRQQLLCPRLRLLLAGCAGWVLGASALLGGFN